MDSMRHLSTSLPGAGKRRQYDTSELLADFKAAALSVTNIYKTAAASNERARVTGYQDALDDLLSFLDREKLGLMDGEGWRVRRWATQRLKDDGASLARHPSEDGDEVSSAAPAGVAAAGPEECGSSPSDASMKDTRTMPSAMDLQPDQIDTGRKPAISDPARPLSPPSMSAPEAFTFRTPHPYPHREAMDVDNPTSTTETPNNVRVIHRNPHRTGRHSRRTNTTSASPTLNFNLGTGTGSKRKAPYSEFFDISGFEGHPGSGAGGKDGRGGGAKRGRHS